MNTMQVSVVTLLSMHGLSAERLEAALVVVEFRM